MARFSVSGGDDGGGEGPSNSHESRKRQRLPSIDAEDAENSYARSSGEEDDEEETQNRGTIIESEDRGSPSDESDDERPIRRKNPLRIRIRKTVNSQSSSSCKDSHLSITLSDSDVLDCPICCEPLKIPIFQCDNGHPACSMCCTKVRNRCPTCTSSIGYVRCRAMEKVIEASRVSCPNAKYGCKENTSYANRFSHEKVCVFNPCSCPMDYCDYIGYYKDLKNHVRVEHKHEPTPFVWNTRLDISLGLNDRTTVLQERNDGEVFVVQVFRGLRAAYVSVSCIAPLAPEVGKFSCRLVNVTVDSLLKQGLMVKNVQKVKNEQPEDGFMLIPSYLLSGNPVSNLQVSISRGRDLIRT